MMTEDEFIGTLSFEKQMLYRALSAKSDFDASVQNVLTMREYRTFKTIQVPNYPQFLDALCNEQQIKDFLTFVRIGKWGVLDAWMANYSQFKEDYERWKHLYKSVRSSTAANQAQGQTSSSAASSPSSAPTSITLQIPANVKKILESRGGITLRRIARETKANVQLKTVNSQKSQIVVSSNNPTEIIAGCREVVRTLGIHQKTNECIYDAKLAKFVASWSKDEMLLFQCRNSCSVIPVLAASDSNSMVLLKTWSAQEMTTALAKVKSLNVSNKKPSQEPGSDDLLMLMRSLKSSDSMDSIPECVNILVLGETGVGKSTFLNAMINYLKFSTLEEAQLNGPEIVVPTNFAYTDYENTMHQIVALPPGVEHHELNQNECQDTGASKTQEPVSYVYVLPGKQEKQIRIIDTPGIGDTRGLQKDEENFEKIMSYIADFPEIHCILMLTKPDSSRLTTSFKYCVQELLGRLHKSACDNVIFGSTHARQTFFRGGQTNTLLKTLLANLKASNGVEVPMKTTYSFDSDSFLYLAGRSQNIKYKQDEVLRYKESWDNGKAETTRMFEAIYQLKPHDVNKTLCINNTKKVIQILSKPLGEITKNLLLNENLLRQKLSEVTELKNKGASLQNKLEWNQPEELESPQTVCTSANCISYENVGGTVKAVPKKICDPNCRHTGVQVETLSNSKLQDCKAMKNGTCTVCGCNWQTHMHIRYKINPVTRKVVNEEVQRLLNEAANELEKTNIFIENTKTQIEELKQNKELILKHSSEFALFVAESSMLAVNDAYSEYLKKLIHEEKNKASAGNDDTLLRKLEQYKETYEEQTRMLKAASEAKTKGVPTRSVDEINKLIDELKALEICGTLLQELQELEVVSVRSSEKYASRKVELTNWKRNLTWLFSPVAKLFGALTL